MECIPAGRKPLHITGSLKSRDMIIQYRMFDMVGILDSYQVKILYGKKEGRNGQLVLYCIIVLQRFIEYKYIDNMQSIGVK